MQADMTILTSSRAAVGLLALTFAFLASAATEPFHAVGSGKPAASKEKTMWMTVDARRFAVTLEDNATVRAFVELLPANFDMVELNGNEKYAKLPRSLPTAAERVGSIRAGDVLLYGDDTLVVFYEALRSGYSYTRIGRIETPAGLGAALGPGGPRVSFSLP
jgi:hypothetical protein